MTLFTIFTCFPGSPDRPVSKVQVLISFYHPTAYLHFFVYTLQPYLVFMTPFSQHLHSSTRFWTSVFSLCTFGFEENQNGYVLSNPAI